MAPTRSKKPASPSFSDEHPLMSVLEELGRACSGKARPATEADRVGGVPAQVVAYPQSTEEVSAVLKVAASWDMTVVARGKGTKLDWGNPPESAEVVVDLSRMGGVLEHASDDLVARVEAGTALAELSERLSARGQWFPVDELVPGSTVGGVVATGLSGPSRYLHGAVRDLVLGVTAVRADGVIFHAGSKVVKNVAGYDLAKLLTASYGTLAVLTELVLKLKPRPATQRFVTASFPAPEALAPALSALLCSQSSPTAIEVDRQSPTVPLEIGVLVEGRPGPTEERAAEIASALPCPEVSVVPPKWWAKLPGPVTLKVTCTLSAVPKLVASVSSLASRSEVPARLTGSAGTGVMFVGLPEDVGPAQLGSFLEGVRAAAAASGGHATLLRAPRALGPSLDTWGAVPGLELMRRVKAQFDPGRRLAPGRFVGGI
jgi:glycolate oxidase FAD binding subunit